MLECSLFVFVLLLCFADVGRGTLRVINRIPYAEPRCIQGFAVLDDDRFLVSEGYWGLSRLLHVSSATGAVLASQNISAEIFAEGIVVHDGVVFVLTYKNARVLRFNATSLQQLGDAQTALRGEGWGLALDHAPPTAFVVSNGSSLLSFRNLASFAETKLLRVTDANGSPVVQINELELVWFGSRRVLLANLWFEEAIVGIDLDTGVVLLRESTRALNVAPANFPQSQKRCGSETTNGIAWSASTNRLFLHGKYWGNIVEAEISWNGQKVGGGLVTTTSATTTTMPTTTTTTPTTTPTMGATTTASTTTTTVTGAATTTAPTESDRSSAATPSSGRSTTMGATKTASTTTTAVTGAAATTATTTAPTETDRSSAAATPPSSSAPSTSTTRPLSPPSSPPSSLFETNFVVSSSSIVVPLVLALMAAALVQFWFFRK
jgi:glutamine cyclotransferase